MLKPTLQNSDSLKQNFRNNSITKSMASPNQIWNVNSISNYLTRVVSFLKRKFGNLKTSSKLIKQPIVVRLVLNSVTSQTEKFKTGFVSTLKVSNTIA